MRDPQSLSVPDPSDPGPSRPTSAASPWPETPLSPDGARERVENLTGFFRVLLEWTAAERDADPPKETTDEPTTP